MAAGVKLTEKAVTSSINADAHIVVTQPEMVEGAQVESVRRLPLSTFVDTSLTVQNAAADAKVVGDTIGAMLETVTYTMTAEGDWRQGYYQRADGAYANRIYYMCTTELVDLGGVIHVSVQPPEGYNASLTFHDANGVFQKVVGYVDSQAYPDQAGVAQASDATGYARMGISIGRFANNDAATYAADPTFTGTIRITVTRLRQMQGAATDRVAALEAAVAELTRRIAALEG